MKTKLFILFLFVFLFSFGVVEATTSCTAKLDWMKNASQYELNHTKLTANNDLYFYNDADIGWSISGGAKNGEILENTTEATVCLKSGTCLNWTYNFTARSSGYSIIVRKNLLYNGTNYTGIGFWYRGDGSENYLEDIAIFTNYTGAEQENKANTNIRNRCSLDSTDWRYCYIDFSIIENTTDSSTRIPFSELNNITGIDLVLINVSSQVGSIFFDNISLVDFDKGSMHWLRWMNYSDLERNARYQEGIYNLALLYNQGGDGYTGNETILNYTIDAMDWMVRNQIWDGGWTEDVLFQSSTTSANVGFPGISFMKSLILLKDNSKLSENLLTFKVENNSFGDITTKTRGQWYNETAERMANYTLNEFTFPYAWYTNQYAGRLYATWLYYNYTGNTDYLDSVNNELTSLNNSWQSTRFGFLPEANNSEKIGIDIGYEMLTIKLLSMFYQESNLPLLASLLRQSDSLVLNTLGATINWRADLINGSRSATTGYLASPSPVYKSADDLNLSYLKQGSYNRELITINSGYSTNFLKHAFRGTYVDYMNDYLWCEPGYEDLGFKFPQNYSTYAYDLLNETAWTRRNESISGAIQEISQLEFPRMLFAYEDNTDWWVRGDYITGNGTDWLYTDTNGNFSISITPNIKINSTTISLANNNSGNIGLGTEIDRPEFANKTGSNFYVTNPHDTDSIKLFVFNLTTSHTVKDITNDIYLFTSHNGNNQYNVTLDPGQEIQVQDYNCVVPYEDMSITADTTFCSGTFYLNGSATAPAIYINADNIILNGNSSIIMGNLSGYGLGKLSAMRTNVTIKNMNINGYTRSIFLNNIINFTLNNLTINNFTHSGIFLRNSTTSVVSNNTIYQNLSTSASGILTDSIGGISFGNSFSENTLYLVYSGISIGGGSLDEIINNDIFNTSANAIVSTSNDTLIYNNLINYAGWNGLDIESFRNNISFNIINNSVHHGIDYVNPSSGNILTSSDNDIYNNTISNTNFTAIYLQNLANSRIYNNLIETIINRTFDRTGIANEGDSSINYGNNLTNNIIKNVDNAINLGSITGDCSGNSFFNITGYHFINSYSSDFKLNNNTVIGGEYDEQNIRIQLSSNNTNLRYYLPDGYNSWFFNSSFSGEGNNYLNIYNLSNTLIYFSNKSVACSDINTCDGNINITLSPNNHSYVLQDFNLTEGTSRTNSPLNIIRISKSKIKITNSVDSITVPVIILNQAVYGKNCENVNKVTYTTNSGIKTVWSSNSAVDICNQLTTNGYSLLIETASGSNELEIEYSITSLARTMLKLLVGFLALSLLGFSSIGIFLYVRNNFSDISTFDYIKYAISLLIILILYLVLINHIVTEVI